MKKLNDFIILIMMIHRKKKVQDIKNETVSQEEIAIGYKIYLSYCIDINSRL